MATAINSLNTNIYLGTFSNLTKYEIKSLQNKLCAIAFKKKLCLHNSSFSLNFVRDAEIAKLNYDFLGLYCPTNVLSFPNNTQDLGTIFISLSTIHREAKFYAQDLDEYFIFLLVHGFAHLLGYEHGQEMDELCQDLLTQLI